MHCKAGFSSHPPEYLPSLAFSIKSDTNMGTEGNFFDSIPSPLVSSQLVHKVGVGTWTFLNLPHPVLQNYNENSIDNNTIITSKVLLLTRQWGGISG
jgi:hypothetical protein